MLPYRGTTRPLLPPCTCHLLPLLQPRKLMWRLSCGIRRSHTPACDSVLFPLSIVGKAFAYLFPAWRCWNQPCMDSREVAQNFSLPFMPVSSSESGLHRELVDVHLLLRRKRVTSGFSGSWVSDEKIMRLNNRDVIELNRLKNFVSRLDKNSSSILKNMTQP